MHGDEPCTWASLHGRLGFACPVVGLLLAVEAAGREGLLWGRLKAKFESTVLGDKNIMGLELEHNTNTKNEIEIKEKRKRAKR